jgi:hypothetical protein
LVLYFPDSLPFFCTFETGLCGYGQAKDDDFDWERKKGSTGSVTTGPSFDHTLGTGKNNTTHDYVFIETDFNRNADCL